MMCFRQQGSPAWLFCLLLALCGGRMGGCGRAWWLLGLALQWAWLCSCMTVKFQSDLPLSVVLNHKLVLEAHINKTSQEKVGRVEWRRENGQGLVQLPTPKDSPMKFEVPNVTKKDYGEYTITVVDPDGGEAKASRIVRESEGGPNVSIPLLCEVSRDSELWDTPKFKWLKDGEEVNNMSGRLSDDGSKLYPASACVHNYTCFASNRLGTNSHQFLNTGCYTPADNQAGCTAPWVLFGVLLLLVLLVAGLVYIRKKSFCLRRSRQGRTVEQSGGSGTEEQSGGSGTVEQSGGSGTVEQSIPLRSPEETSSV